MGEVVTISILIAAVCAFAVIYSLLCGRGEELAAAASGSVLDAFDISMTVAATMAFWSGVMRVAKACGITDALCKAVRPFIGLLMPEIDRSGEAMQAAVMNVTANILGIGNAAAPFGLKAMKALEREHCSRRSLAVFVLLNTASIQLMPATVISLRLRAGSASPADCVLPVLANSLAALLCGLMMTYILYGGVKCKSLQCSRRCS